MKKFLNSKYGEAIILTAASVLNLILTIVFYSVNLTEQCSGLPLWSSNVIETDNYYLYHFGTIFLIAFCIGIFLMAASILLVFLTKKKWGFYASVAYSLVLSTVLFFIHVAIKIFTVGALVCAILSVLLSLTQLIFLIQRRIIEKQNAAPKENQTDAYNGLSESEKAVNPKSLKIFKIVLLVCECIITALLFAAFFIPLYTETSDGASISYVLIKALTDSSYPIYLYVAFIVAFVAFLIGIVYLISTLTYFFLSYKDFIKKSKQYIFGAVAGLLVFLVGGFCLSFFSNISENTTATTVSYIPFVCSLAILLAISILQGVLGVSKEAINLTRKQKLLSLEPLLYICALTAVTFAAPALNFVDINVKVGAYEHNVNLSGYEILTTYQNLESGFQVLAFLLFVSLLVSGVLLVLSAVGYLTKYKDYYNVVKVSAFINVAMVAFIGIFGLYFKIAQSINQDNILSVLNYYKIDLKDNYVYNVSSQTIYSAIVSLAVLVVMLIRGQFNFKPEPTVVEVANAAPEVLQPAPTADTPAPAIKTDFDACPAFTELDLKLPEFNASLNARKENLFENLTLPNMVRFVVDYARESRLHLSYSSEDIATFVAGLGASRLAILQGMSGTGKTSLPKIFAEAIMGNCEIVEVESSWRDKNELIGYYNEFSKCFTPKKFTQCLYKAKLNSEVPTFIVLDEMNLSRIEYYFSDFLSLMEHEEDKREIKLLNIKLYRTVNGEKKSYLGLTDDHTVKMPANVWFIGTANKDESTFEISDKVYDRAQTMNFNKRAPKVHSYSQPLPQKFASYEMITKLFEDAKNDYRFDAEDNSTIKQAEKLLLPYNISFGNRILRQMEDFVKIYCSCFGDRDAVLNDAVEKILLSKVVSKLEYKIVENKEALAKEFDKLGLTACSAFIRRLNED